MTNRLTTLLGLIALVATLAVEAETLLGFDESSSEKQRSLEIAYDENLYVADQDAWLKKFSAAPHHAGSEAGRQIAIDLAELLKSWGYDTEIEEYQILLPTPEIRKLTMTEPEEFRASLRELSLPEDPSTSVRENLLPPYNAFSIDGNVAGELVFINYGRPEDHELL